MPELDLSKRTNSGRGTVHTLTELPKLGKVIEGPTSSQGPRLRSDLGQIS